jgi:DNA ligase-1
METAMEPTFITFECLLASSEIPEPAQVPMPSLVSWKYDGMRCLVVNYVAFSRKMLPFPNLFLQKWVGHYAAYLNGFDCELIVGPPNLPTTYHTTQSAINSMEGRPDFKLYVLDHWDMEGETAIARYEHLKALVEAMPPEVRERVELVQQHTVHHPNQLADLHVQSVALGYEGLMCKKYEGLYKYGRSTLKEGILLKFKDFDRSEIRIEGVKQGMKNTNQKTKNELGKAKRSSHKAGKVPQDIIGGFIGPDINPLSPFFGKKITVGPGSFDKETLKMLWKKHQEWLKDTTQPSPVVGNILSYQYQVSGVKDLPRHPGAKGFRTVIDLS